MIVKYNRNVLLIGLLILVIALFVILSLGQQKQTNQPRLTLSPTRLSPDYCTELGSGFFGTGYSCQVTLGIFPEKNVSGQLVRWRETTSGGIRDVTVNPFAIVTSPVDRYVLVDPQSGIVSLHSSAHININVYASCAYGTGVITLTFAAVDNPSNKVAATFDCQR